MISELPETLGLFFVTKRASGYFPGNAESTHLSDPHPLTSMMFLRAAGLAPAQLESENESWETRWRSDRQR